jgi:hypothetical protein
MQEGMKPNTVSLLAFDACRYYALVLTVLYSGNLPSFLQFLPHFYQAEREWDNGVIAVANEVHFQHWEEQSC